MDFNGKKIVVTGSSRGIGAATARLLHKNGARVIVHGKTKSEELIRVSEELKTDFIFCNIADADSVYEQMLEVSNKHGKIHGLVNCAGSAKAKKFTDMSKQDWLEMIDDNFFGTVNFIQSYLKLKESEQSGVIVNVSSTRGIVEMASERNPGYSVSKAMIPSLTVALARDLGPHVRVNCVAPGGTATDMAHDSWPESNWSKYREESLVKHVADPQEIAQVIAFLLSDNSSYITGRTIIADGGYQFSGK